MQFTQADERKNIESKETLPVLFGKIARWIADLKTVAFSGSYNDLSNKPTIPTVVNNNTTTEAGYALDARQANPNVAGSLGAQINALNSGLTKKVQIQNSSNQMILFHGAVNQTMLQIFVDSSNNLIASYRSANMGDDKWHNIKIGTFS